MSSVLLVYTVEHDTTFFLWHVLAATPPPQDDRLVRTHLTNVTPIMVANNHNMEETNTTTILMVETNITGAIPTITAQTVVAPIRCVQFGLVTSPEI